MSGIQSTPLRIPDQWSATWFRTFVAEVMAKADIRNAVGVGVTIESDGNSVATITAGGDGGLLEHDGEPLAHANAFAFHTSLSDPHPGYVRRGAGESLSFFLGE
jgi:hypothetical protein